MAKKISLKKLDSLWAEIIRNAAGRCEHCGKTQYLNAHHIFSRSKYVTRWDVDNGICLCSGCHTLSSDFSAHKTPVEFVEWLYQYKGEDFINELRRKSHKTYKPDRDKIFKELTRIQKGGIDG